MCNDVLESCCRCGTFREKDSGEETKELLQRCTTAKAEPDVVLLEGRFGANADEEEERAATKSDPRTALRLREQTIAISGSKLFQR
mmetsp:Transcript_9799/g.11715  ORF Transcript_9799/g.11715 Transcript_9799/m.11715 type:complete len:86 (-) Transcript_9799:92-349(-)